MNELRELRQLIKENRITDALSLIIEMEEMYYDDKFCRISHFVEILLIHLIRQKAEKRTLRSWDIMIDISLDKIKIHNTNRETQSVYLQKDNLKKVVQETWKIALEKAAFESFDGQFQTSEYLQMIDSEAIKQEALEKILNYEV
jgi:hypothetical protein